MMTDHLNHKVNYTRNHHFIYALWGMGAMLLAAIALVNPLHAQDNTRLEAEEIVAKSSFTLTKVWNHEQVGGPVQKYFKNAVGVVIVPQSLAGGFIIGGEGGTGILLARGMNGWSYPVFVTVSSASIGLQIGAQTSESVYLIMTRAALEALLKDHVKLGGNLKGAAGPVGSSFDASSSTDLNLDVLSWSIAKGAYIGASVAGTAFVPREALNRAYYNTGALDPAQVVLNGIASNPQADNLRLLLQEYSNGLR
ncbi:MAG: lipid-binding SYLF domain-containing protein [Alphaproteobacteria bacterium]